MQSQNIQNSALGNGLQGTGISTGSGLQPQDSNTQQQSATQPQQDVLGVDQYRTFDGTVQGPPPSTPVTAATTSYTALYIGIILLLIVAAVIAFLKYKKAAKVLDSVLSDTQEFAPLEAAVLAVHEKPAQKPVKKAKKTKQSNTKLKKKTTGSKAKRKK